jgi:hypothetical protein
MFIITVDLTICDKKKTSLVLWSCENSFRLEWILFADGKRILKVFNNKLLIFFKKKIKEEKLNLHFQFWESQFKNLNFIYFISI